ncbi:MAG: hypothetical protein Q9188_000517 [Gyalolechia gomerana]
MVQNADSSRLPIRARYAFNIAKHGGLVDLIGYKVSELHPGIESNQYSKWLFLLLVPFKVIHQTCSLYYALGYRTPPAKWLLVQNPPTIPTLLVAQFICFIRKTRLIIDWHNFGFSILGLKLGPTYPLVRISKSLEQAFCSKAYAHLVVSDAMKRVLKEDWKLMGLVLPLHDRPFDHFHPLRESQRFEFLTQCPETAFAVDEIRRGMTKVLISSTSWTPDEDFSLLLNALISYSDMAASTRSYLPKILTIITGKGPLKDAFVAKIGTATDEGRLNRVQIRTAWLSSEDYAKLLASADLGVSLHTSSSGVDLPMKAVDMLGAGLPVVGWDQFEAWPELVQEGINGRGFHSSAALSKLLVALFGDDSQQLHRLRQGALGESKRRWEDEWDPVAGKLLGFCNWILDMLADVKLPFHPTATDCLAWSEDGELAIAAGEFVHILVPIKMTSEMID